MTTLMEQFARWWASTDAGITAVLGRDVSSPGRPVEIFVRQMPKMSPAQYQAVISSAPEDHDAMMKDMPGMTKTMP